MKELKVGDRFLLPDGNDGRLIEVQELDRHSLCDRYLIRISPVSISASDIVILRDVQTIRM